MFYQIKKLFKIKLKIKLYIFKFKKLLTHEIMIRYLFKFSELSFLFRNFQGNLFVGFDALYTCHCVFEFQDILEHLTGNKVEMTFFQQEIF